jgi:hypothetical protein
MAEVCVNFGYLEKMKDETIQEDYAEGRQKL